MLFKNIDILKEDMTVLENGFLAVENGIITYIGKEKPTKIYEKIYDGKNKLIVSGFINTHCHSPMTLLRGAGNDLNLQDWLTKVIFPKEKKLTAEDVYWGSMLGIYEMVSSGVTSFSDMYYFCPSTARAVLESGISANISHSISCFDDNDTSQLILAEDLYKEYHGEDNGRLMVDFCLHSEYTTTKKSASKVIDMAKKYNTSLQVHICETQKEVDECYARHNLSVVEYFESLGLFEINTSAAHCVYLTPNDIELIKGKSFSVSHCPISNLKLGSGIANVANLIANNVNVSLGTDGAASNDNLNFLEDLKISSLLQKGYNKNPSAITTAQVLKMATANGAKAQKRKNTGTIKEGNFADLVVFDFNMPNLSTCADKTSGIIYSATSNNIALTMCRGKVVYENGEHKTIDVEKMSYHINKIKEKLNS